MPLPSRDQAFALESCRDLLEKLDRELDRYRAVAGRDQNEPQALFDLVNQLKDSAFNAAVTAWQLGDWVFNDMTPEHRQALAINSLGDLFSHVKKNCRALYLCRHAATASKHWIVNKNPDDKVRVQVEYEAGWTVNFIDDGVKTPAELVFALALEFWTNFIYEHGIAKAALGDIATTVAEN
jgi:hypothetical protein